MKPPAKPATFKDVPPKSLAQGKKWKLTLVTSCGTITIDAGRREGAQATASAIFLARQKFCGGDAVPPGHHRGDLRPPVR